MQLLNRWFRRHSQQQTTHRDTTVKHYGRWPVFGFWLLILLIWLPTLQGGFIQDDYLLLQHLSNPAGLFGLHWHLYQFVAQGTAPTLIANGHLSWWSSPQLVINFLRPLSSLMLSVDWLLAHKTAWFYHLDSILWMLAFLLLWHRLLIQHFPKALTYTCVLITAISTVYLMPLMWIANRNALLALVFMLSSVLTYDNSSRQNPRLNYIASLLFFTAALLSGEISLSGLGFLLFSDGIHPTQPLATKLKKQSPFYLILIIYLILYRGFGFGVFHSAHYLNPWQQPWRFAYALIVRLPQIISYALLGWLPARYPTILSWNFHSWLAQMAFIGGFLLTGLIAARALLNETQQRAWYWMFGSGIFAAVPLVIGAPQQRHFVFVFLGVSVCLSSILLAGYRCFGKTLTLHRKQRWLLMIAAIYISIAHVFVSGTNMLIRPWLFGYTNRHLLQHVRNFTPKPQCGAVLLAATPPALSPMFLHAMRHFTQQPALKNWYILALTLQPVSLNQVGRKHYRLTLSSEVLKQAAMADLRKALTAYIPRNIFHTKIFNAKIQLPKQSQPLRINFIIKPEMQHSLCIYQYTMKSGFQHTAPNLQYRT